MGQPTSQLPRCCTAAVILAIFSVCSFYIDKLFPDAYDPDSRLSLGTGCIGAFIFFFWGYFDPTSLPEPYRALEQLMF
jgi:hypothetical protein